MKRAIRVAIASPALVGAITAGGLTSGAAAAAIDVAPSAGASSMVDRGLDATARAAFGLDQLDEAAVAPSAGFTCEVMDMTPDPEADD